LGFVLRVLSGVDVLDTSIFSLLPLLIGIHFFCRCKSGKSNI
jgi:hypothetical protein